MRQSNDKPNKPTKEKTQSLQESIDALLKAAKEMAALKEQAKRTSGMPENSANKDSTGQAESKDKK